MCLFDASNGIKGVCDVLSVNNVQRQQGSQTLNFCASDGLLAMAGLAEGLMLESKEGAHRGQDKRQSVVRTKYLFYKKSLRSFDLVLLRKTLKTCVY